MKTVSVRALLVAIVVIAALVSIGIHVRRRFIVDVLPSRPTGSADPTAKDLASEFHTVLPNSEKQHLLDGDFKVITNTAELPPFIRNAFATITGDRPFALADPGTKYQRTDVIYEQGLAHRRLVLGGVRKNRWFIHYEHGGIGVSYAVMILDAGPDNSVKFVWGGTGLQPAKNLDALRNAIALGTFTDNYVFYW